VRDAINAARTDNKNSVLMRVKSGGSSRFVGDPPGEKAEVSRLERDPESDEAIRIMTEAMEGVAGISRPRRRLFPGAGREARSLQATFRWNTPPLRREVKGR